MRCLNLFFYKTVLGTFKFGYVMDDKLVEVFEKNVINLHCAHMIYDWYGYCKCITISEKKIVFSSPPNND